MFAPPIFVLPDHGKALAFEDGEEDVQMLAGVFLRHKAAVLGDQVSGQFGFLGNDKTEPFRQSGKVYQLTGVSE